MKSLTKSGAGVLLAGDSLREPGSAASLQELLDQHRFVVIKQAFETASAAVSFLAQFGPINEATTRKDGAVIVEDEESDEVFRSNLDLPLHKDGILTGFDVILVGIFCIEFKQVTGGRTFVSDAQRALERVPKDEVELLRENGIEGMAVDDSGYFRPEFGAMWHHFPAFKAKPGRAPSLHLGLPHAPGEPESWRVRVAGIDKRRSDAILSSLRSALLHEDYTYFHDWEKGDIIVFDNYAVLHGREAFEARSRRLANIQVIAT